MATNKEQNGDKGNGGANRPGQQPASQAGVREPAAAKVEEQGVVGQAQATGRDIVSKSLDTISERTRAATSGYKSDISSGLHTLADGLRQTSATFQNGGEDKPLSTAGARYIDDLAQKIESVSDYFERKDPADVVQDVKRFARQNPTIFVGGAFALGFAVSRLFRSAAYRNEVSNGARTS